LHQAAERVDGVAVVGDAADPEVCARAVEVAVARWGRLDRLVNCAGIGVFGTALDAKPADWNAVMRANLETTLVAAQACQPELIRNRGSITAVSSLAGLVAVPNSVAYVTSKHALLGLIRSIAIDFGRQGVRANAVCPGLVRTAMADGVMDAMGAKAGLDRDESYRRVGAVTPLGAWAEPEDIAEVIAFLAGPRARVITGQVIVADCGVSAADLTFAAAFGPE
jgi:NAD(P)-dependent dehydrogenase (short-subunit alcohol dehydrogenase family)